MYDKDIDDRPLPPLHDWSKATIVIGTTPSTWGTDDEELVKEMITEFSSRLHEMFPRVNLLYDELGRIEGDQYAFLAEWYRQLKREVEKEFNPMESRPLQYAASRVGSFSDPKEEIGHYKAKVTLDGEILAEYASLPEDWPGEAVVAS